MLFEALFRVEGLHDVVGLNLPGGYDTRAGIDFTRDVVPFIYQLRGIYRTEPRYHNYEHALDVLQACYMMLKKTGMVPSVRILLEDPDRTWEPTRSYDAAEGPLVNCLDVHDLFAIYITAIGHDVGHPGFTNAFMVCSSIHPDSIQDTNMLCSSSNQPILLSHLSIHPLR